MIVHVHVMHVLFLKIQGFYSVDVHVGQWIEVLNGFVEV